MINNIGIFIKYNLILNKYNINEFLAALGFIKIFIYIIIRGNCRADAEDELYILFFIKNK